LSEAARNKVFYLILVFAVFMIFMGAALGNISMGQDNRVIIDLGILASRVFGVLLAMFVGVYLVYDEIERRTLYTLIAHGTRRWQFILGKYFGLLITISINVVVMCGLLLLVLFLWGQKESPIPWETIVWQMSLVVMEMGVVIAFAILFSSFSTPVLSAFLTFFLWIIGNSTLDILGHVVNYQEHKHLPWLAEVFRAVYLPLPQLGVFNIIRYTLYAEPLEFTLFPYVYGIVYSAGILGIATLIFSRKDIK
jgi:ABC-type transport system involved in multi-copper enzyme maturation permease subunit